MRMPTLMHRDRLVSSLSSHYRQRCLVLVQGLPLSLNVVPTSCSVCPPVLAARDLPSRPQRCYRKPPVSQEDTGRCCGVVALLDLFEPAIQLQLLVLRQRLDARVLARRLSAVESAALLPHARAWRHASVTESACGRGAVDVALGQTNTASLVAASYSS